MSITSQRQKAVDFAMPYMNTGKIVYRKLECEIDHITKTQKDRFLYPTLKLTFLAITGIGILYKKKKPPPPNLFSFMAPLSVDVWIYMITAYLLSSILMFLLGR